MELFGRMVMVSRQINLASPIRSYHRCTTTGSLLRLSHPPATPFWATGDRTRIPPNTASNSLGGFRTKILRYPEKGVKKFPGERIDYYGFSYFPRPGEVDPPYEPTKLFMVRRIEKLFAKPWWEKEIMYELGLYEKPRAKISGRSDPIIIKNTPENCKKLHRVKHLVEIVPVTFPKGFPKNATSGFLKENGEFEAYSDIGEARAKNLEEETKSLEKVHGEVLQRDTLKKRLHKRWFSRWDANI